MAEKLFPKPTYAGDSIMIRFYGTDLPGITALFESTTTGQAIVDKIRRKSFTILFNFPPTHLGYFLMRETFFE